MADKYLPKEINQTPTTAHEERFTVPTIISDAGEDAARHFIEFFIASIRNRHTRRSYARQVCLFLTWCERHGIHELKAIRVAHVATYIEMMTRSELETASVKQALSALRRLFDWLVVHQVIPRNPATSVRGPKLVIAEGKTPYIDSDEVAKLFESIPTNTVVGLRDRALIGVMAYTFARIGAAVMLNIKDYFPQGKHPALRLREKGGKRKQIAVHHVLEEYLDAYIQAAGITDEPTSPLFRTAKGKTGKLTEERMSQSDAWRMLQRRAKKAGIMTAFSNHSFRAAGITTFLENDGALETAQYMAGHADPRTTKLYDRRRQLVTRTEVERIRYEKRARTASL